MNCNKMGLDSNGFLLSHERGSEYHILYINCTICPAVKHDLALSIAHNLLLLDRLRLLEMLQIKPPMGIPEEYYESDTLSFFPRRENQYLACCRVKNKIVRGFLQPHLLADCIRVVIEKAVNALITRAIEQAYLSEIIPITKEVKV